MKKKIKTKRLKTEIKTTKKINVHFLKEKREGKKTKQPQKIKDWN